jgi:hypothetical protein
MDKRSARHAAFAALLLAALAALPACSRDEPAAPPAAPQVAAPPAPAPAPAPPAPARPTGLQPAAEPVLSTPVPEGFARERAAQTSEPWVHVRGRAPLDQVIEFYTRYLDPGTPASAGPDQQPRCTSWSVGARPGCTGNDCVERTCLARVGGLTRFLLQHPKQPGEPTAEVNVLITTVGAEVRVTIQNESLMRILRENAAAEEQKARELPEKALPQYQNLEDIPPDLID